VADSGSAKPIPGTADSVGETGNVPVRKHVGSAHLRTA
jgi:hypothetical protein